MSSAESPSRAAHRQPDEVAHVRPTAPKVFGQGNVGVHNDDDDMGSASEDGYTTNEIHPSRQAPRLQHPSLPNNVSSNNAFEVPDDVSPSDQLQTSTLPVGNYGSPTASTGKSKKQKRDKLDRSGKKTSKSKMSSQLLEGSGDHIVVGMRDPQPAVAVLVEQSRGPRVANGGADSEANSSSFVSSWVREQAVVQSSSGGGGGVDAVQAPVHSLVTLENTEEDVPRTQQQHSSSSLHYPQQQQQQEHHHQHHQQFHHHNRMGGGASELDGRAEPTLPMVAPLHPSAGGFDPQQHHHQQHAPPLVGLTTSGDGRLDVQRASALSANSLEGDQSRSKLSIPAAIQIGPSMAGLTNLVVNASEKRMSDSSLMGGGDGETPIVIASPPPGAQGYSGVADPSREPKQEAKLHTPPAPKPKPTHVALPPPGVIVEAGDSSPPQVLIAATPSAGANNSSDDPAAVAAAVYSQYPINTGSQEGNIPGGEFSTSRTGTHASSSMRGRFEAQGLPYVPDINSIGKGHSRKAVISAQQGEGGYTTQSTRTPTVKSGGAQSSHRKQKGNASRQSNIAGSKYTAIASNHTRSVASASNVAIEIGTTGGEGDDAIDNQMREISTGYDSDEEPQGRGGARGSTLMKIIHKIPFFVVVAIAMSIPLLVLISLDLTQLHLAVDRLDFLEKHKPLIDAATKCDFDLMLERGISSVRLAREGRDPSLIPEESLNDIRQYGIELTKQRQAVDASCGEVRRLAIDGSDQLFSGAYADDISSALAELQTTRFKIDANISMTATLARQFFTFDLIGKMSKLRLLAATEEKMQAAVPGIMQLQYIQEVYNQLGLCRAVGAQMLLFSNFSSMIIHSPGIHIEFFNCRSGFRTQSSLLRSVINGPTPFDTNPEILAAIKLMDEMDPETSIGVTNVTTKEWFDTFSRAFLSRELEPDYEAQIRRQVTRSALFVTFGIVLSVICAAAVMRVQFLLMRRIKGSLAQSRRLNMTIAKFVPRSFLKMNGCQSILDIGPGQQTQVAVALLYSDIRNFGTISQGMSSEAIFVWLDGYMSRVAGITESYSGFVEKFLGDAVFSVFSNPGDAALCAIEMQKETDVMNVKADFTGVSQDAENKQREVDNDSYSSMGELMRPVDERRAVPGSNHQSPQQQPALSSAQYPHHPNMPAPPQVLTASAALASGLQQQQLGGEVGGEVLVTGGQSSYHPQAVAVMASSSPPHHHQRHQPAPENSSIIRLLRTAVGIHFGVVSCGIMGDSHRLSPMLVSPAVNLPPRIQALSRHYGSRILLTDATAEHLDRGRFGIRKLGPVRLDGGEVGQFTLWELYQSDPHEIQLFKHQHRDKFERAMDLRSRGDRMEASRLLDAIRERGIHQGIQDKPLEVKIRHVSDEDDSGVDAFTN